MQISVLTLVLLTGMNHPVLYSQANAGYWDENVALLDFRTRTVDQRSYVREIQVFDFLKAELLDPNFGFGEDLFSDDGQGYDERAGDGVYTSAKSYPHSPEVPYQAIGANFHVFQKVIVDNHFKHNKQLQALLGAGEANIPEMSATGGELTIQCDIIRCKCPSECICPACEWGIIEWCLDWSNCRVGAGGTW